MNNLTFPTFLVPVGRLLFSAIFIMASFGHFTAADIAFAEMKHVPLPSVLVPLSGLMILVGGISVLLGYKAKIGAGLIFLFLIIITPLMHNFWVETDQQMMMMQQANFMKNFALAGASLIICHFGAGPYSLDEKTGNK